MATQFIAAALANWISGDVIARRTVDEYGTEIVITKDADGYSVLRAFGIGEVAHVSVDLQDVPETKVIEHLLSKYDPR